MNTNSLLKKTIKKHTVEVTVKENLPKLKKFLANKNIDVLFAKNNTIIFEVSCKKDKIYKILNRIFTKGFMLSDLHIKKPTLDDIFIKIARREK